MRQAGGAPNVEARGERTTNRISFRVTDTEMAVLGVRAAQRGTDRAGWVKALMRRHLGLKGHVDDGLRETLGPVRMQLQRIGRNLNQAMKAGRPLLPHENAVNHCAGDADTDFCLLKSAEP